MHGLTNPKFKINFVLGRDYF